MGGFAAAILYGWLGHAIGIAMAPWSISLIQRARCVALWGASLVALVYVTDPMSLLLTLGALIVVLAPASPAHRAGFFLAAVTCSPTYLREPIPFPAINFLIELTVYKVASIVLFVPLLIREFTTRNSDSRFDLSIALMTMFAVYTAVVVGDAINATSGLRFLADQIIVLLLPLTAMTVAIKKIEDFDAILETFVIASSILAALTLVATFKQWDFYRLHEPPSTFEFWDVRSGFVRIGLTINTHSLGYHLAAAFVALEYLKHRISFNVFHLMTLRAVFLAAIYFTDSRGALGGLLFAFATSLVCSTRSGSVRAGLIMLGAAACAAVIVWLLTGDFTSLDPHGTIAYRQQLLAASISQISEYPIFGKFFFLVDGRFDHLMLATKIIDITNLYLQILLHYGAVGLVLFMGAILVSIRGLLMATVMRPVRSPYPFRFRMSFYLPVKTVYDETRENWIRACSVVAGVLVGWLFLVATTSDVGVTLHLGIVFAALGRGLLKLGSAEPVTAPSLVPSDGRVAG